VSFLGVGIKFKVIWCFWKFLILCDRKRSIFGKFRSEKAYFWYYMIGKDLFLANLDRKWHIFDTMWSEMVCSWYYVIGKWLFFGNFNPTNKFYRKNFNQKMFTFVDLWSKYDFTNILGPISYAKKTTVKPLIEPPGLYFSTHLSKGGSIRGFMVYLPHSWRFTLKFHEFQFKNTSNHSKPTKKTILSTRSVQTIPTKNVPFTFSQR
jgi:hypothetical protein